MRYAARCGSFVLIFLLCCASWRGATAQTRSEALPVQAPPPLLSLPALANPPPIEAAVSAPAPLLPPAQLAAFVDGVVRAYMNRDGIAGVTVAVADRNGTLLAQGYGDAALAPPRAVDPATTLFRIGSISKTFAYIATMQLVEQGKLKLDADVNDYLPERLKLAADGYPPVRVWNLMTHTAGFADSALGHLFRKSPANVPTLVDYLARHRPARVRPPGEHAVYSNYSVALLGAIVQQVSGEPYDAYIERHILQPLGMRHTTFREPLPASDPRHVGAALEPDWSTAFLRADGGYTSEPFEYISAIAPAGAGSSTAADMARYMRMLLNGGALDGQAVLKPETFAELTSVNYRNAPEVGGIAHGFFRLPYGRYQSLEHGGATLYFLSDLVVLPDAGLGVFVSTNTDTGRRLATTLPRLILEHFLADARPALLPQPAKDFITTGQRFTGHYLSERRPYATLEKLFDASAFDVSVSQDGYLTISGEGETNRYVQDGPLSFRATVGDNRIAFLQDKAGRITGFASAYGHSVADRVGFMETRSGLAIGLLALLLVCVGVLLCLWRRGARTPRRPARGGQLAAASLVTTTFIWLGFLAVFGIAAAQMAAAGNDVVFTYPSAALHIAVGVAYAAALATLLAILVLPSAWGARDWTLWRKLRHVIVLVVMLHTIVLLWHWKMLGAPLALGL